MLNYIVITMMCENMKNDDGELLYHRFIKKNVDIDNRNSKKEE